MVYLYGAGGHAKVIADILELRGIMPAGIFDDDPLKKLWNYPFFTFPGPFNFSADELIISIGNNNTRKKICKEKNNVNYQTAIHPAAILSMHSLIGEGSVVMGGALINADTSIGKHCIINSSASIDHDCFIGDFVHISPGATLCGGVIVRECTLIGTGAIIIPGKKIGANTTIGAGAIVTSDIPDNVIAVGSPARIIKQNQ
jgi:sugar O-acyltransferase (sialic acid O-acetyltransferase NeuD family)